MVRELLEGRESTAPVFVLVQRELGMVEGGRGMGCTLAWILQAERVLDSHSEVAVAGRRDRRTLRKRSPYRM